MLFQLAGSHYTRCNGRSLLCVSKEPLSTHEITDSNITQGSRMSTGVLSLELAAAGVSKGRGQAGKGAQPTVKLKPGRQSAAWQPRPSRGGRQPSCLPLILQKVLHFERRHAACTAPGRGHGSKGGRVTSCFIRIASCLGTDAARTPATSALLLPLLLSLLLRMLTGARRGDGLPPLLVLHVSRSKHPRHACGRAVGGGDNILLLIQLQLQAGWVGRQAGRQAGTHIAGRRAVWEWGKAGMQA